METFTMVKLGGMAVFLVVVINILQIQPIHAATPACGSTLTNNTTLDADMDCDGTALSFTAGSSNNVTLDCAGFMVENNGFGAAIGIHNVEGVVVENCSILTSINNGHGISVSDSSNSEITNNSIVTEDGSSMGILLTNSNDFLITNNVISTQQSSAYGIRLQNTNFSSITGNELSTAGTFGIGIGLSQSSNNSINDNAVSVLGVSAKALQLQSSSTENSVSGNTLLSESSLGVRVRAGSNSNTFTQNIVESAGSNAMSIESSSNNTLTGNSFTSPSSYILIRKHVIQNGGLSVDSAGNIFIVENNFGGSGGSGGAVTTFAQIDSTSGDPMSFVRLQLAGDDPGYGFDSLEVLPNGRYLVTRGGGGSSLQEIDPVSGDITNLSITFPVLDGGLNGLQVVDNNNLLATTNMGELLSIDLIAETATLIGDDGIPVIDGDGPPGWTDLAMHPTSGRLYVTSRWSHEFSGTSHLYEINPDTGELIAEIGDTGAAFVSDIDFSADATLYANSGLYSIDINTGVGTFMGGFGEDPHEAESANNTLSEQTLAAPAVGSNPPVASVQFLETIDIPSTASIELVTDSIVLTENSIFIDSVQFPFLDIPARITFENLSGTERSILIDVDNNGSFETCEEPQCTIISFIDGTLVFDVLGFSTYSSEEVAGGSKGGGQVSPWILLLLFTMSWMKTRGSWCRLLNYKKT